MFAVNRIRVKRPYMQILAVPRAHLQPVLQLVLLLLSPLVPPVLALLPLVHLLLLQLPLLPPAGLPQVLLLAAAPAVVHLLHHQQQCQVEQQQQQERQQEEQVVPAGTAAYPRMRPAAPSGARLAASPAVP
jgi:hypothetical protein